MQNGRVLLSVQDLSVNFKVRGRELQAIRGISLDFYEGESVAIVGESGSGKSVLTKTFSGMLDDNGYISGGKVIFDDGAPIELSSLQKNRQWGKIRGGKIATVFQDPMTGTYGWQKLS